MSGVDAGAVARLWRYPVKSMRGEELTAARVGRRGVLGDRGYAVVDLADDVVASAKRPARWGGLLHFRAAYADEPRPEQAPPPVAITFPDGTVHRSDAGGIDDALSRWFGRPVHLSASPRPDDEFEEVLAQLDGITPPPRRPVRERSRMGRLVPGASFFDLDALHLVTDAALARVGAVGPTTAADIARYRPNVVVATGGTGFVENGWATVDLGDRVRVEVSQLTARCVMPTLAQGALPADRDVVRALARHNRLPTRDGAAPAACLGVYAGVARSGLVTLDDRVVVTPAPDRARDLSARSGG